MPDDIASELRLAFGLASMRKAAELLKTPDQWASADAIVTRSQRLRETEERLFQERYRTRLEAARRRIVDEAGSRQRSFTPIWAGADRFDAAQTLRQADREVRQAHEGRLGRIDGIESRALTGLLARSRRQNVGTERKPENGPERGPRRTGPEE